VAAAGAGRIDQHLRGGWGGKGLEQRRHQIAENALDVQ